MRQGKNDMKVAGWEQFLLTGLGPSLPWYLLAFGTMPVAA